MFTLIIIGWILSQMATPTIIWVCYGVSVTTWIFIVVSRLLSALIKEPMIP